MPKLVKTVWSGRKLYGPHTDELPPVDTWAGLPDEVWDVPPALDLAEPDGIVDSGALAWKAPADAEPMTADDLAAAVAEHIDPDPGRTPDAPVTQEQLDALAAERQGDPVEKQAEADRQELLDLRERAKGLGITVDRRWKATRIRNEIAKAHSQAAQQ